VVAPDDAHLEIVAGGIVQVRGGAEVAGHRPSGTLLLRSIAACYRSRAVGVVLSGMGTDGAEGLQEVERVGGLAVIEDPATSVVPGMPGAAVASTRAPLIVSGETISHVIALVLKGP